MICDVCNTRVPEGDGARISPERFRQLLNRGWGVHESNITLMAADARVSREQARAMLKAQYLKSQTDWLLCQTCIDEVNQLGTTTPSKAQPSPNQRLTSLDATALSASQFVTKSVLDDFHWQVFGFPGRPKRGAISRVFVSSQRLATEGILKTELAYLALTEIATWAFGASHFPFRDVFVARVLEICLDGFGTPVWPAYGFHSRRDGLGNFRYALLTYGFGSLEDHGRIFLSRTLPSIPKDAHPNWLIGAARLIADQQSMYPHIRASLTEATSRPTYDNDIELADPELLPLIKSVFDDL